MQLRGGASLTSCLLMFIWFWSHLMTLTCRQAQPMPCFYLCNYTQTKDLKVFLFSLLKPSCWSVPLGPKWMGAFIPKTVCTSSFIVPHVPAQNRHMSFSILEGLQGICLSRWDTKSHRPSKRRSVWTKLKGAFENWVGSVILLLSLRPNSYRLYRLTTVCNVWL